MILRRHCPVGRSPILSLGTCLVCVVYAVQACGPSKVSHPAAKTSQTPAESSFDPPFAGEDSVDPTHHACSDGYRLRYRLDRPMNQETGRRYPLLLCLHGAGGKSHAPEILNEIGGPPCFVLVPSVPPKEFSWSGRRRNGLPYVLELVDDLLKTESIDPDRIYVTGQSMGGFGAFGAVAMRPEFFAASVPVCGGWRTEDAGSMHKVPMWIFHGDADRVVPVRYSSDMVKALREAGGSPRYTEYEGVGHNSWLNAYGSEELWVWLFKQRRTPADSIEESGGLDEPSLLDSGG